jgi:hypothetical protein
MVKVLFLDVDGVINVPHGMDRKLLNNLKGIVSKTGCKIVLSSDWRNTAASRSEIRGILRSLGMDITSCTPPSKSSTQARRPEEILDWIRAHNAKVETNEGDSAKFGKVEAFVAIDDRPLLNEVCGAHLRGHFVRTSTSIGLTQQRAQMAIDILSGHGSGCTEFAAAAENGSSDSSVHGTNLRGSCGWQARARGTSRSSLAAVGLQRVADTTAGTPAGRRTVSLPTLNRSVK